jgi:stage II sporulation protein D
MRKFDLQHTIVGQKQDVSTLLRCVSATISILLCNWAITSAQIRVGLLDKVEVKTILISPMEGNYVLANEAADTIYRFRSDDAVSLSLSDQQIIAKSAYGLNDTLNAVYLLGEGNKPTFKTRINEESKDGVYYQSLEVSASENSLNLVNKVDIERYVSRVVQAEVGYGAAEEYYKIQSIICRTYAIRNLERHTLEGFDLCDHEHCQVYSGRKSPTTEVVKATAATAGLVMLSKENDLVLSAFHANCGGQTANSEDVWKEERSYLKSVTDTFCLSSRSATWEKTLNRDEFYNQLGWKDDDSNSSWSWKNINRKKYFVLGADSIQTSKMRMLLRLRSAFFDVELKEDKVLLTGKGYGHGVGVCQQGAMKMAEAGYSYSQILGYYYKGVSLAPISSLQTEN